MIRGWFVLLLVSITLGMCFKISPGGFVIRDCFCVLNYILMHRKCIENSNDFHNSGVK